MGILDDDIGSIENKQSDDELKEAICEFGAPTEHEFACYQNAITTLAKRTNTSEYDTFMNADDGEIIDLLTDEGVEDDRAEDILDQCAQRWKPRDPSKS